MDSELTAEMHGAYGDSEDRGDHDFRKPSVLELGPKHDEHDVEGDNHGTQRDDDGSDNVRRLVRNVRQAGDGELPNVICRMSERASPQQETDACQRPRNRRSCR